MSAVGAEPHAGTSREDVPGDATRNGAGDRVAAVLGRLHGVRRSGDGWKAQCPAHHDAHASLSVSTRDDGSVLLHCHAGCPTPAVLAALGLKFADLFAVEREPAARLSRETALTLVATYDYRAMNGTLLYQACRYQPKTFRVRRPDGHGGWAWNLDGVSPVIYRLPELAGRSLAVITEGEKDADALAALGFPATTNHGGAGRFRRCHAEQLRDVGVVQALVLADNDHAGREHAATVRRELDAVGVRAETLELPGLPEHGDVSDWLAAGHTFVELCDLGDEVLTRPHADPDLSVAPAVGSDASSSAAVTSQARRTLTVTRASAIRVRAVRWLWALRLAIGTLGLLGGREGLGKSTIGYTLAAALTRGRLPGAFVGQPTSVIVAATEDSWEHTIVPRLMAADADLDRVLRVNVTQSDGVEGSLSLPQDLPGLHRLIVEHRARLVLLDPLLSRLDAALDTHKDAEVRLALEPLVRLAGDADACVLGLIHVNKSASIDPLTMLMGSRAFAAVARSVLFVMTDPEDDSRRLLGAPKNNLGRTDLPTLAFQIVGAKVAETPEGEVWTSKIEWLGETDQTIREAIVSATENAGDRTAKQEAMLWLVDYLTTQGGSGDSASAKDAGKKAGHTVDALQRARQALGIVTEHRGFPRHTYWTLPTRQSSDVSASLSSDQSSDSPGETTTTQTTQITDANRGVRASAQSTESLQSSESSDTPPARATTGAVHSTSTTARHSPGSGAEK